MSTRLRRGVYRLFGHLPGWTRGLVVRWWTPSYHVGVLCLVERADGRILLVRDVYRQGWGLPGGLLGRHEEPSRAVHREVREEVGLAVVLDARPSVVVDPQARRVDIVFCGRPEDDGAADGAVASSPEIDEARWFAPDDLPALHEESATALVELGRAQVAQPRPPGASP